MFCQNCGAELRAEAAFCAVCGASVPKPVLRQEGDERSSKSQRLSAPPQAASASSRAYNPASGPALAGPSAHPAPQPDPRQIRSFQAIRQASGQRGGMRALAPAASLSVPSSPPEPPQSAAAPTPQAPPSAPLDAPAAPAHANGHAPAVQTALNGYHPVSAPTAADAPAPSANGHTPGAPAVQYRAASAPARGGLRLPNDIPNRLALSALAGMFLSFLLPWVIFGGTRATPLSIGWPVLLPLAAIIAVGLTILFPERTLYTRFILALPFAFGCFALGSAFVIFLVSSAIAANSVGPAFLGVDIGFIFFVLAALMLASAGYFKFLRELPLLAAGQLRLAPLPAALAGHSASPAPPAPDNANLASAGEAEPTDQRSPPA